MSQVLLVAAGGAIGAVARYLIALACGRLLGSALPFGTLLANLIGCLLIGLALGWTFDGRLGLSEEARLLVVVGLLGGLTTFSSFSFEAFELLRSGRVPAAMLYSFGSLGLGTLLAAIGYALAPGP